MKANSNHLEKQLAKTKAEKTGEEIRAFAAEGKIELSPDMLEAINGGGLPESDVFLIYNKCHICGSRNVERFIVDPGTYYAWGVRCKDCGWSIC